MYKINNSTILFKTTIIKERIATPSVKYLIELSDDDRRKLMDIVRKGSAPAKTILRANILLASDRNGKHPMTVQEIAETYHTSATTVQNVRASYAEKGLELQQEYIDKMTSEGVTFIYPSESDKVAMADAAVKAIASFPELSEGLSDRIAEAIE